MLADIARSGSFTLKCGTATTSTLTVTETATCVYDIMCAGAGQGGLAAALARVLSSHALTRAAARGAVHAAARLPSLCEGLGRAPDHPTA